MTSPYYGGSNLRLMYPEGFDLTGMPDQPVLIYTDDGWRKYPGADFPVKMMMPDGTWKDMLWTPTWGLPQS
jgi:hypothetical protein